MLLEKIRILKILTFTENFNSAYAAPSLQTNGGATSERKRRRHEVIRMKEK